MAFQEPRALLPDWGPYSKKYMGISKVIREGRMEALRFDLVVHPTLENCSIPVPNLTFPANFHPWEAASDLSYYAYRYELEKRDEVYADIAFVRLSEDAVLVRTEFVNHSPVGQNVVLNYFASLEAPFPTVCKANQPEKCVLKNCSDYETLTFAKPRPWEHLNPDGLRKGVFFDPRFYDNRGVGDRALAPEYVSHPPFGTEPGDTITLTLEVPETYKNAVLHVRGHAMAQTAQLKAELFHRGAPLLTENVTFGKELSLSAIPVGRVEAGTLTLTLTGTGSGAELDFAALTEAGETVSLTQHSTTAIPQEEQLAEGYRLSYQTTPEQFYLHPLSDGYHIRRIPTGCLEDCLVNRLSQPDATFDDLLSPFCRSFSRKHSDDGFYWNLVTDSRYLNAGEHHVEYLILGGSEQVFAQTDPEARYLAAKAKAAFPSLSADGAPYEFSGRILQATLMTNIVYPVWRRDSWIKHFCPGKRWDSLYTWDTGFIGLGLLEWEPGLAEYMLKLYLSEEDNSDWAFLFHGSPVPVQIYLFYELLQRTSDKERLYAEYPKAKRYYNFLAGKTEGSTTDKFKSRLTTTFDYFYNASGMDDLPPQVYVHQNRLEHLSAPAISSSQLIRIGKMLKTIAQHMGLAEDVQVYEQDIALRSKALQDYAWDEKSGYFGYVLHNENGEPVDVLRSAQGENLSKGVEGVYPLIAGVCTEEQKRILLAHIFSEQEMFTKFGISSVDMTAGYFNLHGYWNGHVWMPHQWFIWKTMLDLGEGDKAWKIAETALNTWKGETDYSWNTYEMFSIATGRGGWFHQFGGLSAPVNVWACAYFRPGTVNVGYDTWLSEQHYDAQSDSFTIRFEKNAAPGLLIAVTKGDANGYTVTLDGEELPCTMRTSGALEIVLPENCPGGALLIRKK